MYSDSVVTDVMTEGDCSRMNGSRSTTRRIAVAHRDLPGRSIDILSELFDVTVWHESRSPLADEVAEFAADADALMCMGNVAIDAALFDRCPNLHLVALVSAGYDRVDVDACRVRNVMVTNTPGVLHRSTADLTFALMLGARRLLTPAIDLLRAGEWQPLGLHEMLGLDVHGSVLGIIGFGEIGREVARRARGFDMAVVHHNRTMRPSPDSQWVPFDDLLATADIVSVHVPLSDNTRHLLGRREFALMKSTATLINTSRGAVVDTDALVDALASCSIHSAGLDVFDVEPFRELGHPLFALPNAFLLPHVGSATEAARTAMVDKAAHNVTAVLHGSPAPNPLPGLRDLDRIVSST